MVPGQQKRLSQGGKVSHDPVIETYSELPADFYQRGYAD